jgi:hypothetical protein
MNFISHKEEIKPTEEFLCDDIFIIIFEFLLLKDQIQFSSVAKQIRKIFIPTENYSIHMIHSHYHLLRKKIKTTTQFSRVNERIQKVIQENISSQIESKCKQNLISNWNLPNDYFISFKFKSYKHLDSNSYSTNIEWRSETCLTNIETVIELLDSSDVSTDYGDPKYPKDSNYMFFLSFLIIGIGYE